MKNYSKLLMPFTMMVAMAFFGCQEMVDLDPVDSAAIENGNSQLANASKNLTNARATSCTIGPNDHLCRTRDLIAGQNYVVGTVKVYCTDGTSDYKVVYDVTPGCYISEVHVYAGPESDIPKNGPGCPKIGNFPHKMEGLNATSVCVDVGTLPDDFTVAAHAVVNCSGSPFGGEETAWGKGKGFDGCNNWSMCFDVDCKKP